MTILISQWSLVLSRSYGLVPRRNENVRLRDSEAYNWLAWVLILLGNASSSRQYLARNESSSSDWQVAGITNAIGILIVSIVSTKKLSGLASGLFNLCLVATSETWSTSPV